MSDKYIIKNCPNYIRGKSGNYCDLDAGSCKDCTDCILKQVVELCKENLSSLETYVDVRSLECVTLQNILNLLDIQEVE